MKPNTVKNDIERWRQQDAGLRRALQTRFAQQPELPKGFEERMLQRMAEETARKKKRTLWARIAAAAAIIGIIAGTTPLWLNQEPAQLAFDNGDSVLQPPVQPVPTTPPTTHSSSRPHSTPKTSSQTHSTPITNSPHPAPIASSPSLPSESVLGGFPAESTPENQKAETAMATPSYEEESLSEAHLHDIPSEQADAMPDYASRALRTPRPTRIETATHQASHLLAIRTFMGADGGTINMDLASMDATDTHYQEQIDAPSITPATRPANYYFPSGSGYTYDFGQNGNATQNKYGAPIPGVALKKTTEPNLSTTKHLLPITVGATVQWYLTHQWAIETGLTYTRLASTFDNGTYSSYQHREQHIHYLGIPVRLHAQLLQRKRWHIYAAAGFSTELPVAASVTTRQITLTQHTDALRTHLSAPIQFSLGLGAGVSFDITPVIGIYAEPSAQWFVPTDGKIETYRTQHPLRFTPQVGIRWNLKQGIKQ